MSEPEDILLFEFAEEEFPGQIIAALGELFPVFDERKLVNKNPLSGKMSLDYCGFATSGSRLVTVLPKYLRKQFAGIHAPGEKAKIQKVAAGKLFRLLKRNQYGARNQKNIEVAAADFMNENTAGFTNELAIAEFILLDYQDNGLWFYNEKIVMVDAGGDTDWELTINNIDPIISGGMPYYFSTYSSTDELVTDSLITRIHKYAINYCNRRYAFLLDLEMADEPDAVSDPEDLGDLYSLLYAIEKQLRITFREREILLLKALGELIEIGFSRSGEAMSLYGRRDFEQVWEAALQYTFRHNSDLRGELFSLPQWFNALTGKYLAVNINDTLKPDVLRKIKMGDRELLLILDAKYYLLNYEWKGSFPPIGDIIKQYFYEAGVTRKEIGYRSADVINAFIFPAINPPASGWFENGGHVWLDNDMFTLINVSGKIKKPVLTFNLSPDIIFERYTRLSAFSEAEVYDFIDSAFSYLDKLPSV
ncbi:LlaJI family restriction endonuclease [Mucilaginibacter sp. McL0603]|uniref:LlaJI family restriction endonuclease n=1 Tax=Mucilaginibacter sp. McL0603 TaxID=3415670 RepID=UPI003CF3A2AE